MTCWILVVLGALWFVTLAVSTQGEKTYPDKRWSNEDVAWVVWIYAAGYTLVGAALYRLLDRYHLTGGGS